MTHSKKCLKQNVMGHFCCDHRHFLWAEGKDCSESHGKSCGQLAGFKHGLSWRIWNLIQAETQIAADVLCLSHSLPCYLGHPTSSLSVSSFAFCACCLRNFNTLIFITEETFPIFTLLLIESAHLWWGLHVGSVNLSWLPIPYVIC